MWQLENNDKRKGIRSKSFFQACFNTVSRITMGPKCLIIDSILGGGLSF